MAADGAAAPKSEAEALAARLRASLGAFGYQWLCACAVYPRLRFSLSGHLGDVLAQALGRPPVGEDEMLALFSLPWFRQGWLPDDLRRVLLADIEPRVLAMTRGAIETVMYAAAADDGGDLATAPVALAAPPRDWARALRAELDALPPGAAENDPAFVRAMRRQSVQPQAVDRERRVVRALGDWAKPLLRWQTGAVMALAGGLVVAWGTSDLWLRPVFLRQETIVERVAAPVTPPPATQSPPVVETAPESGPAAETPPPKVRPRPRPRPAVPDKQPQPDCPGGRIVNRAGVCVCPAGMVEGAPGTRVAGICRKAPEPEPPVQQTAPPPSTDGKGVANELAPSTQAQPSRPLEDYASASPLTRAAQLRLNEAGYKIAADGIAGPQMRAILEEYQKTKGLRVTGELNSETLNALGVVAASAR